MTTYSAPFATWNVVKPSWYEPEAPLGSKEARHGRCLTDVTLDGASWNDTFFDYMGHLDHPRRLKNRVKFSRPRTGEEKLASLAKEEGTKKTEDSRDVRNAMSRTWSSGDFLSTGGPTTLAAESSPLHGLVRRNDSVPARHRQVPPCAPAMIQDCGNRPPRRNQPNHRALKGSCSQPTLRSRLGVQAPEIGAGVLMPRHSPELTPWSLHCLPRHGRDASCLSD